MIDLRSDTVTQPSDAMRRAMADAVVGDDFYRDDPSVRALEERAAALLGKEAGLFVPSGTMGNLLAHMGHAPLGGDVVGPEAAHSFRNEGGGPARVAGVTVRSFPFVEGTEIARRYQALIAPSDILSPGTKLLWVEQPHRGFVSALDTLEAIRALAEQHRIPVHLDGARIFNAAVALGVTAAAIAAYADTVMFCVSKSLGAPVGSLLLGEQAFVDQARANRQMLGGGMRQSGVLAAAGLYALENNIDRLVIDHDNARRLATRVAALDGLTLDRATVDTNIFYADVSGIGCTGAEFSARLKAGGVLVNAPLTGSRVRFVTHLGVTSEDVDRAAEVIGGLVG